MGNADGDEQVVPRAATFRLPDGDVEAERGAMPGKV